ncbi:hypothetical protein GGR51DRAFT_560456 [Nemania sp. FL0031]|nr:hypothetical protein GGR51DRAFT_560456 [Nemania sp. FL0031]
MYFTPNNVFQGPGFPREDQNSGNTPAAHTATPLFAANGMYQNHIPPYPQFQPQPEQQWQSPIHRSHSQEQVRIHQWDRQNQGDTHTFFHGGGPGGYLQSAPHQIEHRIIQIGEGMTIAGQSTEDFESRPRVYLCYQCCKRISLRSLIGTREDSCGDTTCERTQCAGLQFIPMPQEAADACDKFRIFLDWWMDKVELGVDECIEKRARDRVLEMREGIPDVTLANYNQVGI